MGPARRRRARTLRSLADLCPGNLGHVTQDDRDNTPAPPPPGRETVAPEQMQVRLAKVERLRAAGVEPYPVGYPRTHAIADVRAEFGSLPADTYTGVTVGVAGRVMLYRNGGKLCFARLRDGS